MMIGLHDADLIYRNENVHESEKMAHHMDFRDAFRLPETHTATR